MDDETTPIKVNDLPQGINTEYTEQCIVCNNTHVIYAEGNNFAEYETWVHVKCSCGNLVQFVLPVN